MKRHTESHRMRAAKQEFSGSDPGAAPNHRAAPGPSIYSLAVSTINASYCDIRSRNNGWMASIFSS